MDDQRSLEAQLLGDMTYDDPRKRQTPQQGIDPRLAGATVPVLDDMSGGAPAAAPRPVTQYQELTDEQVAILQQQRAAAGQPPYTPDEIAELKAEFIERQRIAAQEAALAQQAAAQKAAAAALLAEPEDYNAPEKRVTHEVLPQVDASALLEEPAPEPERKVYMNTDDIAAAQKSAAKRASESLNEVPQKTEEEQKRARQQMEELRRQQMEELAQRGFFVSIIMTVMGVVAGLCTVMFASGAYEDGKDMAPGVFVFFDKCYMFAGIAMILLAITVVLRVKKVKGLASGIFILTSILLIVPGIVSLLSQKKGAEGGGVTVVCYILAIVLGIAFTVVMSVSDKLNAYYAKSDIIYD